MSTHYPAEIWRKSYPKGVPYEIHLDPHLSLPQLLKEAAIKFRDQTAYENFGQEMSFEEVDQASDDFASFLQNVAGLKKGDRIALQLPNVLQYPVALYGALKAGLVVVNTNPLYTAREMKFQLQDSGAKAIVIYAGAAHNLEAILSDTPLETVVVTEIGDLLGFPKRILVNSVLRYVKKMVPSYSLPSSISFLDALDLGGEKTLQPVPLTGADLAFLQYTGGTTGVAKGAMLTHSNVVANVSQIMEWIKIKLEEGQERVVAALPLYHIFSLTVSAFGLFNFGACNHLITNPRDLDGFIKLLKRHKFTVFPGLNTLFNALLHHPDFIKLNLRHLKISVAGGMALQRAVALKWMEVTHTPVVEGYGLTETSPVACVNPPDGRDKIGSIGLPVPSTWVRMEDENGLEVPRGQVGEICIKGPQVMQGYWQMSDETNRVLNSEGWFRTGDLGTMDEDGYIKIVDRKKDMILVSGFNVYPNEVEDVIVGHPKVLEVAAIGAPDEKSTEVVKVVIVPKDDSLTTEEVIEFARKSLAAYKVPRHVEFRRELPKSNVGKILRRVLKEESLSGRD